MCPKPHRNYRLKSKRNRNGNVGDRYVPIHASLMAGLKDYIERKELRETDLVFPNLEGNVEGHYLRKLQGIVKRANLPAGFCEVRQVPSSTRHGSSASS